MILPYTARNTQIRLAGLGFNPGPIDGMRGAKTNKALREAMEERHADTALELFHPAGILRVHGHWDAGKGKMNASAFNHYNRCIDQDLARHDGKYGVEAQSRYRVGHAASHTLNANSHAAAIAALGMFGSRERPFDPGKYPVTEEQVLAMAEDTAGWCLMYDIPVSRYTTLWHAEVQPTLGIKQRWKWDAVWWEGLAPKPVDAIEAGDAWREMIQNAIDGEAACAA